MPKPKLRKARAFVSLTIEEPASGPENSSGKATDPHLKTADSHRVRVDHPRRRLQLPDLERRVVGERSDQDRRNLYTYDTCMTYDL